MSYDIYTGLLKMYPLPHENKSCVNFISDDNHPGFEKLKNTYPVENIAGNGNDFSKAKELLHWLFNHTYHKGDYSGGIANNSLDLLTYAYDKGLEFGINCVCLSKILTECLLAIGIYAKQVFIMPCSPYDGDNHCVTHVFLSELNKWVMFDPTLNAYFVNTEGKYLNLLEIRSHLSDQKPIFFNDEAKYNDDEWTDESANSNIEYYAKNTFYFQTPEKSTFGECSNNRVITISPNGYDPKKRTLININYRMNTWGTNPNMEKWKEGAEKEKYTFCSTVDFE
jgi:hypothetical protein